MKKELCLGCNVHVRTPEGLDFTGTVYSVFEEWAGVISLSGGFYVVKSEHCTVL